MITLSNGTELKVGMTIYAITGFTGHLYKYYKNDKITITYLYDNERRIKIRFFEEGFDEERTDTLMKEQFAEFFNPVIINWKVKLEVVK